MAVHIFTTRPNYLWNPMNRVLDGPPRLSERLERKTISSFCWESNHDSSDIRLIAQELQRLSYPDPTSSSDLAYTVS